MVRLAAGEPTPAHPPLDRSPVPARAKACDRGQAKGAARQGVSARGRPARGSSRCSAALRVGRVEHDNSAVVGGRGRRRPPHAPLVASPSSRSPLGRGRCQLPPLGQGGIGSGGGGALEHCRAEGGTARRRERGPPAGGRPDGAQSGDGGWFYGGFGVRGVWQAFGEKARCVCCAWPVAKPTNCACPPWLRRCRSTAPCRRSPLHGAFEDLRARIA